MMRGKKYTNSNVQQIAAAASEIASAANTPLTPIKLGRSKASGIKRITLRNKAIKMDILLCPKATKVF